MGLALLSGQPENEKSANYSGRSLIFQDGEELPTVVMIIGVAHHRHRSLTRM
ncbi:MAG: hypothetical protein V7K89_22185 [Nostoc sp.]|uniref:hypothetical protein n=1 Tax=Nostoc sp. TaxID=1180 RepID=UPI002FF4FEE1